MIPIIVQNGLHFIWDASDWLKIREEFRIVGNLTGCLVCLPRQDILSGLPLALLKEEVTLLVEKNIAFVVGGEILKNIPDSETRTKFMLYRENNRKEQVTCYDFQRKQQITSMIDKIVEGKRRKLLGLNTKKKKQNSGIESSSESATGDIKCSNSLDLKIDKEEILKNELDKSSLNSSPPLLVQTSTSEPWLEISEADKIQWTYPESTEEVLKYSVFKDLWEKGFYITEGNKFGVDYLVYPGDPVKFHAQFIVECMDYNKPFSSLDIISYARLGSISRKTFVIASCPPKSKDILYQSIQWMDKS